MRCFGGIKWRWRFPCTSRSLVATESRKPAIKFQAPGTLVDGRTRKTATFLELGHLLAFAGMDELALVRRQNFC